MSEQQQGANKSTQTLGTGILVILWITAVFIIIVLNGIKSQLETLNNRVSSLTSMSSRNTLDQHMIVEPHELGEEGKVVYMIDRVPEPEVPEDEMLEDMAPPPADGDAK